MACGCNKSKPKNRSKIINRAKKTSARRSMPLVTIRRISNLNNKNVKK